MAFLRKIYRNIFKKDGEFKGLVFKALFYAMQVRFMMLFVKFKRYEKRLGTRGKKDDSAISEDQMKVVMKVKSAVIGVSKYTPWESKCMVQAVAAKWLLEKYNIPSTIYFGIMKDPENNAELKAHAWLIVGEYVMTGREGHKAFKVVNFYS
jgi:hypothetical protein